MSIATAWPATTTGANASPIQNEPVDMRFVHQRPQNIDQFQVDFVGNQRVVPPGGEVASESRLFAGAKVVTLIDKYAERYGIEVRPVVVPQGGELPEGGAFSAHTPTEALVNSGDALVHIGSAD